MLTLRSRPVIESSTYRRSQRFSYRDWSWSRSVDHGVELLERESALSDLERAATAAVDGNGRIVVVQGPAGIGKTALVAAFVAGFDGPVLSGACDDLSIPQVLGPFEDIVRDDPILEAPFAAGMASFRRALLETLGRQPSVVVIEDLHWADEATIDLLSFLARRLTGLPAVIIATVRTELAIDHPATRLLASIHHDAGVRITLDELSREAVARLTEPTPGAGAEIYDMTGGNPFLVTELLTWGEAVPPTVADSVAGRIASLPNSAGEVAALLSVIPGQAAWDLVDHLLPGAAESLADLELAGVIASSPEGISFRHELLRRAVAERLAAFANRRLNQTVLRSVLAVGGPPSHIAHHAAAAGDIDVLLRHGRAAIEEAVRAGAHGQALAHVRSLVPHAHRLPPNDEADLWRVAAIEYRSDNDLRSASSAIWRAIQLREQFDDPFGLATDLGHAATFAWEESEAEECFRLRKRAISILESRGPSRELALAYVFHGQDLSLASQFPEALAWIDKAIRSTDDEEVLAIARAAREPVRVMMGEGEIARADGDMAIEVLAALHDHDPLALVHTNRIAAAINALDLEHVEEDVRAALDFSADLDQARFAASLTMHIGRIHLLRGRWEAAREASGLGLDRVPSGMRRVTGLVVRALLRGRIGDRSALDPLGEAVDLVHGSDDIQRLHGVCAATAELTWLDLMDDVDLVRAGYELAAPSGFLRGYSELAIWLRRLGHQVAHEGPAPPPHALELAGEYRAAAQAWAQMGVPYQQALTMAFSGDSDLMRGSLEVLDELGAIAVRDRVRQMMREHGFTVGRGKSASTRANPDGLTRRQMEVLRLLVEDLSDREIAERLFISPKTVGHHVSAILTKLGVESRRQAADYLPNK